jgi:hypothetical protein
MSDTVRSLREPRLKDRHGQSRPATFNPSKASECLSSMYQKYPAGPMDHVGHEDRLFPHRVPAVRLCAKRRSAGGSRHCSRSQAATSRMGMTARERQSMHNVSHAFNSVDVRCCDRRGGSAWRHGPTNAGPLGAIGPVAQLRTMAKRQARMDGCDVQDLNCLALPASGGTRPRS